MTTPTAPAWAPRAPFFIHEEPTFVFSNASPPKGASDRCVAVVGDINDAADAIDEAVADLLVAAPGFALILVLLAQGWSYLPDHPSAGHVTLATEENDDVVSWSFELDEAGLPMISGAAYREIAARAGWASAPVGEAGS